MTGQGGWPLNVFATPEGVPFWGGTYFPPDQSYGRPSWRMGDRGAGGRVARQARRDRRGRRAPARAARRGRAAAAVRGADRAAAPRRRRHRLRETYDAVNGGWGGAPKFPAASTVEFILRRGEREMTAHTLRAMATAACTTRSAAASRATRSTRPGPSRTSKKMLYDNALLARAYLHGWLVTGEELFRRVAVETLDWALREMRAPEGGFYAALDADSEGVEGRYYAWTVDELREVLGELADPAIAWTGATVRGNFDGSNVLEARGPEPAERDEIRARLLAARERRVRPGLDDKRLASWNALMISALADAGAVLERPRLPGRRPGGGGLRPAGHARRLGAPAAHLQRGRGAHRRVPRGPRVPARGPAHALRGDLRAAVVRRRAGDRRHDDRAVRGSRARRVLLDRRRPRAPGGAAQGARRRADPVRERERRARPAAPHGADRRAALRAHTRSPSCASCIRSSPAIPGRSATCSRRSTSTSPPCARSRSWATTSPRSRAWSARGCGRTSCSPAGSPMGCRS